MSKTNQPKWRFVANLGDATPLDHGGAFVFRDATGVYGVEMVVFEGMEDDEKTTSVSRILCERCTLTNGILSDNKSHPLYEVWFAKRLHEVAEFCGMEESELQRLLCSDDPCELGFAYQILIGFHGPFEFDQYPEKMTRAEIRKYYRGAFRRKSRK